MLNKFKSLYKNKQIKTIKNIILIDDDISILQIIEELIKYSNFKCNVEKYTSAKLALNEIISNYKNGKTYDIAIIDWLMPELNGELFSFLLKSQIPNIKIILYTASNNDEFLKKMYIYEIDAVIKKGTDSNKLLNTINDFLYDTE